jgi:hypothetical protein
LEFLMAKFVGGPYDGMEISHEQINRHASVMPMPAGRQNRLFLLMPPRAEWERICRGEIIKDQAGGPLHAYERVFVPDGAEFHDASDGRLDEATAGKEDPAFAEVMENMPHEEKLGRLLEDRLARFLDKAQLEVIPPGTLLSAVGFSISPYSSVEYLSIE